MVAKRIKYGRPVYSADRWHFHHRFANIGFSQRRTVLYLYGWTLSLAALALAMRFVPYSDDDGTLHAGWTLVIVGFALIAVAASVYLVLVLEILKFKRFRERELRRQVETGEISALSADEIDRTIEREVETGEFQAVRPTDGAAPPAGGSHPRDRRVRGRRPARLGAVPAAFPRRDPGGGDHARVPALGSSARPGRRAAAHGGGGARDRLGRAGGPRRDHGRGRGACGARLARRAVRGAGRPRRRPDLAHRAALGRRGPAAPLREQADLDSAELERLRARLERFDSASRHGPWTRATSELIAASPETRAEDLAASVGREKLPFKRDVRKLKELGLTESLLVGYRLSPRGRALLESLGALNGAIRADPRRTLSAHR